MVFRILKLIIVPSRCKKYYPLWKIPYNLDDFQNITRGKPNPHEQWNVEWKNSKLPKELRPFDVLKLPSYLKARYNPTPTFFEPQHRIEQSADYRRRLFGLYGFKSGVDPSTLFDISKTVEVDKARESDLGYSSVVEFIRECEESQMNERKENEAKMLKIKKNLDKMPDLIDKFNEVNRKNLKTKQERNEKIQRFMEIARDRFGYYPNSKDDKFKTLRVELEEKEKLEKKEKRKEKKA